MTRTTNLGEETMMKGGNFYNKYESKNPLVKLVVRTYLQNLDFLVETSNVKKILEVGCGEGYIIKHLREKFNVNIIGMDISNDILEIARSMNPNLKFFLGDIYKLGFKDDSFDMVLILEVLEHLKYPNRALEEIKRVSKEYVIVSVPNEPIFRAMNILRLKYLQNWGNTPGHVNNWNKKDFITLLEKHFEILELKTPMIWNMSLCRIGR